MDFFVQRIDDDLQQMDVLTRSIAVDTSIQSQLAQLTAADPEPGDDRRAKLTDALDSTPGSFVLLPPDADYLYFVCGRDVLRSQNMSMQRLGTVLVTVDIEKRLNSQINALSNKLSELYLYNKEALVYQSGKTAAELTLPGTRQGYAVQTINGQKVFVCWLTSKLSGLRLCSIFSYEDIYGRTSRARGAAARRLCYPCAVRLGHAADGAPCHPPGAYPERGGQERGGRRF